MEKPNNSSEMTDYQRFIATSRYSRWLDDEKRRETWPEVVDRYLGFFSHLIKDAKTKETLREKILNLEVMPSMRALMTAGPALERNNVAGYNCAYLPVDSPRAFDEAMFVLMCGTGVGFSVEQRNVDQLPIVNEHFEETETTIHVADSKEGWARSLRELIGLLYTGQVPRWDTTKVRRAGERLRTFGGRASGPEPLESLFRFVVDTFKKAKGRRLSTLECHDIMCKIGEVVVVGGVRRSAMISLSDVNDDRMRGAKSGNWWEHNVQRALANNSATYVGRPDTSVFLGEWKALYDSHSGERGMFSRDASQRQAAKFGRREAEHAFGTNPCSEIILRPYQFCNLSEIVVRSDDDAASLREKAIAAAILGTLQSTLTNFKYLRKVWQTNTEEERLLGVSLTGILDHKTLCYDKKLLNELRDLVVETNKIWAKALGIPQSTATTCVKPSGTVSQLVDSASGIHPRWSEYYVRTVRGDIKDPLTQFLIDQGVPNEPDVTKPHDTVVFSFPQRAPEGATVRADITAVDHLEIWKTLQEEWCEHKPSITVNVKEDEWMDVQAWVWKNWDILSGVSFLPYSEHTYKQAPYQEIDKEEYEAWVQKSPARIEWERLSEFELEDTTTGTQELACAAGFCEIV
jgi:ribonucleoside-diphosphate reductase alpha chain